MTYNSYINRALALSLGCLSLLNFGLVGSADAKAKPVVENPKSTETGMLRCNVEPGIGLIITSQKALSCVFDGGTGGRPQRYVGTITKFGLDLGVTAGGELVWTVFRVGKQPRKGALVGRYAGVSAEVTAGLGLGVNALVGGPRNSISLQPFSVSGQSGLNIAAGVSELNLQSAR